MCRRALGASGSLPALCGLQGSKAFHNTLDFFIVCSKNACYALARGRLYPDCWVACARKEAHVRGQEKTRTSFHATDMVECRGLV